MIPRQLHLVSSQDSIIQNPAHLQDSPTHYYAVPIPAEKLKEEQSPRLYTLGMNLESKMDPKTVVYESSDDEEYSYGWDDFKMQVEALDHSQSPTQPLVKVLGEKLSISQEITPRAPRVDVRSRRHVSHDEEMCEINKVIALDSDSGSALSTEQSSLFSSHMTSMSSIESTGLKRAPNWLLPPPPAVKRKVSPGAPVVNLPQVGKSRKRSSPEFIVELDIVHIVHCEKAQSLLD
ncbi:hypothetical protein EV702DRAFT_1047152 [Suillus placidus]|uniref:Uncharacterized protein n=1 Tax=Suillus placidus TaxID=48579 RepID=A0A9P6ZS99_9AGAM|nr:hypothetical protein EV702DRAFT_1047152 [Suillus placidus]